MGQETNCCKCCSSISSSLSHFLQLLLLHFLVHKIHMKTFFLSKGTGQPPFPPPSSHPTFLVLKEKVSQKRVVSVLHTFVTAWSTDRQQDFHFFGYSVEKARISKLWLFWCKNVISISRVLLRCECYFGVEMMTKNIYLAIWRSGKMHNQFEVNAWTWSIS